MLHLQHGEHKLRSAIAILKTESQRAHLELSSLRDDLASSMQAKEEAERRMEEYRIKHVQIDAKASSMRWRKRLQAETNALRIELAQQHQASMLKDQQLKESHEEVVALRRQLQQQQDETKALRSELDNQKLRLEESKNRSSMLLAQRTRASIAEISSLLRSLQDMKIQVSSVQNQCTNLAEHVQRTDAAVSSLNDHDMCNIKARQRRVADAFTTIQEHISGANTSAHHHFQLVAVNEEAPNTNTFVSVRERTNTIDLPIPHLGMDVTAQTNHISTEDIDDTKALRKVADELYSNLKKITKDNQQI